MKEVYEKPIAELIDFTIQNEIMSSDVDPDIDSSVGEW